MTPRFLTIDDVVGLSRELASKVDQDKRPDVLVGIANGAILPTKVMADHLNVCFEIVRVRRRGSRHKEMVYRILSCLGIPMSIFHWRPLYSLFYYLHGRKRNLDLVEEGDGFSFNVKDKSVLIVDDVLQSGRSVAYVRERLITKGAASVRVAVLHYLDDVLPDVSLDRTDGLWWFPWSYNSPHYAEYRTWLAQNGLQ